MSNESLYSRYVSAAVRAFDIEMSIQLINNPDTGHLLGQIWLEWYLGHQIHTWWSAPHLKVLADQIQSQLPLLDMVMSISDRLDGISGLNVSETSEVMHGTALILSSSRVIPDAESMSLLIGPTQSMLDLRLDTVSTLMHDNRWLYAIYVIVTHMYQTSYYQAQDFK